MELTSKPLVPRHPLSPLTAEAGTALFRAVAMQGTDKELADTVEAYHGHALSLISC